MTISSIISRPARLVSAVVAVLAMLIAGVAVAPAASANITGFTTSVATGTVGSPVLLTATSNSGLIGASVTFQANGAGIGTASLNSNGVAQLWWSPPAATTYTLTANDGQSSTALIFPVNATNTFTSVAVPNVVQLGVPTLVTATVTSQSPSSVQPAGSVTFFLATGQPIATIPLNPTTIASQSSATVSWTPATLGTFNFFAVYNPTSTGLNASTSPLDSVTVTATANIVSLVLPPVFYQGAPTTIIAVVPAGSAGVMSFSINGQPISGGVQVAANGVASTVWTPQSTGARSITATFTGTNGVTGATTDTVNVLASNNPDFITLTPSGQAAWSTSSANQLLNAQRLTLNAGTLSGSSVTLATAAPCTLSGNVITVNQGSGSCTLTATSNGGNGYGMVTQAYPINVDPGVQTAKLSAPKSGKINTGKVVLLQKDGVRTNANRSIVWRVTSGSSVCKLIFPSNGNVQLQGVKNGNCTVVASASAVKNQWQAMRQTYNYRMV